MADEITEFLRRAAARKLEAQRRAETPPPPQPSRPRTPEVVEAEVVEAEVIVPQDEPRRLVSKISKTVAKDLDTRKFEKRAGRLGDQIEQADERLAGHLHQTFDHALGSIAGGTKSLTAQDSPEHVASVWHLPDHPLLSMLANPASVKQAMILADLLRRPEENW